MRAMLSLTWQQVDFTKKRAWVASHEIKAGSSLCIPPTSHSIQVLKTLPKNGDYIFKWHGERIDDCNTLAFQNAVKAAKVVPLRWHDLRHTWASWAVQSGVTLHELMLLEDNRISFNNSPRGARCNWHHEAARSHAKLTQSLWPYCKSKEVETEKNIRTVPGEWNSSGSLLGPHIGQLCLAQVEFPLDSAPRFIFQLAASIQLIDLLPFGFD
jgi:hypothetical protein